MVTICQKCGDKGFSVALIYCDKCEVYAEHRYCLDKIPETFDEYVTWFCEDCAPKVAEPAIAIPRAVTSKKTFRARLRTWQMTLPKTIKKNNKSKARRKKKVTTSSVAKSELQKRESSPSHSHKASHSDNYENEQNLGKESEVMVEDRGCPIEEAESNEPPKASHSKESENDQTLGKARLLLPEDRDSPMEEASGSHQPRKARRTEDFENDPKLGKESISVLKDRGSPNSAESRELNTLQVVTGDPSIIPEHKIYVPAKPIIQPVWRGSFSICDDDFNSIDGLAAHLSSKACLKVCEEAKTLPRLLCSDLLPRSYVWPKSFAASGPGDDHIGLYFFPETERDEVDFDRLVECMIDQDLAIKAIATNAELLVFTSTQLPMEYWRFQAKYYLWGVFRGKQASVSLKGDGRHMGYNSGNESSVRSNSVGPGEENELKKTSRRRSPLSPLSNCGSNGSS